MREWKGISKSENLRNYLNPVETKRLDYFEHKIAGMVDTLKILNMDDKEIYQKIKDADIR